MHEVPLKEAHAYTREGCKLCPDFAAEHADISTGGIGAFGDWTLVIVRTDKGRELLSGLKENGSSRRDRATTTPGAWRCCTARPGVAQALARDADPGPRRLPFSVAPRQ
jgi:coenzyme F420-reducing hydrogenase beta subunit